MAAANYRAAWIGAARENRASAAISKPALALVIRKPPRPSRNRMCLSWGGGVQDSLLFSIGMTAQAQEPCRSLLSVEPRMVLSVAMLVRGANVCREGPTFAPALRNVGINFI